MKRKKSELNELKELTELVRLILASTFSEFERERCAWHDGVTIPPNHPDSAENL